MAKSALPANKRLFFTREEMLIADSVCSTGYKNVETCGHKSSADKHNPVQLGSVLSVQSSGLGSTRLSCSVPACFCLHTGHSNPPPPLELQCSKLQEKKKRTPLSTAKLIFMV